MRVGLGSLEFPVVQWTIEEEWNRLYFSEGFRLTSALSSFRLYERVDDQEGTEHVIRLPPYLNTIKSITNGRGNTTLVTCCEPHGLWNNDACILTVVDWCDVEIMCSSLGRVSLTALHLSGQLTYVSEDSFSIPRMECDGMDSGFVHVPTYPSPILLCNALSYVLAHTPTLTRYEFVYNAHTNQAVLQANQYPIDASRLEVRLYGSGLTRLLGYQAPVHDRIFVRPLGTHDRQFTEFDFYSGPKNTSEPPLILPSEAFAGWHYVELAQGWYAPAHRPMCTGQPLRLSDQVELSLNRLNFARKDTIDGMASGHVLAFADPAGCRHLCTIYAGRYTAESLAAALETEMTRLSSRAMPGTLFTVEYDADEARFTFACEVRDEIAVRPAPFSLFLPHPNSIDPCRLGFDPVSLHGRDSYKSSQAVRVPSMESQLLRHKPLHGD